MATFKIVIVLLFALTSILAASCGQSMSQSKKPIQQMPKVEVQILSLLTYSEKDNQFSLTFGATSDTTKKLTMLIGKNEAETLTIAIENMQPTAPLPLDLLQEAITKFGYKVKEVLIDSLKDEVYSAKIVCIGDNKEIILNSRPADAATIATKFQCPIYVNEDFLKP
jgi:bifunctional DNase/RNase